MDKEFLERSRSLRSNMTPQEKKLWYQYLKKAESTLESTKSNRTIHIRFLLQRDIVGYRN